MDISIKIKAAAIELVNLNYIINKQNKYINLNNLLVADDVINLKNKKQAFIYISGNDLKILCPGVCT
jgi:hypothetical protein